MRENPAGEGKNTGLKLLFDRNLRLEFRGAKITTDAGLLSVRELDEMMGLSDMAGDLIIDKRRSPCGYRGVRSTRTMGRQSG